MKMADYQRLCRGASVSGGLPGGIHLLGVVQVALWLAVLWAVWLVLDICGRGQPSLALSVPGLPAPAVATGGDATLVSPARYDSRGLLAILLAVGLVLLLAAVAVDHLRRSFVAKLASRLASSLRSQLHRQIYRLGQSALPTEGISPVVDLFTHEVDAVRNGLVSELNGRWRWPALGLGLAAGSLLLSWKLALFLLLLAALVGLTARAIRRRAWEHGEAARHDVSVQVGLLQEDLGLVRTVRVFGVEGLDKRRFEDHLEEYRAADRRRLMVEGSPISANLLLFGAAGAVALGLAGDSVLSRRVQPSTALMLAICLGLLALPAVRWIRMHRRLRVAGDAAGQICRFLDRKPELLQIANAKFLPPMRDRISFENVTVTSPSGRKLVEGLTLQIPAHSRMAIMGRDGESNHALACLIPRLIDPSSGRVRIDGHDLREVTLESLRAQVATVLQSDLVFSDTVAANLGLGEPSYELPRLIEAAKVAHAHQFIQELPQGYDTYIGPLGHFLRVDEQYRIALARALLHDPSIVIIEEPRGAMDEDVKHLIDDTITRLGEGRTLVFLPHRQSTIRACQHLVILHRGRLEAAGSPHELQASSKIFRHLQYVEFNQFAADEIEAAV